MDNLHPVMKDAILRVMPELATMPTDGFARLMATDAFREALDNGEDIKTATNYAEAVYHNIMNREKQEDSHARFDYE